MTYIMCVFMFGLVLGLIVVASNPSPYFGALGLVVVSGMGCGVLAGHGASFLSLILFLIYLGGMLVVFAYSAALAAEPYPETPGSRPVVFNAVGYFVGVFLGASFFWGGWFEESWVTVDELVWVFQFYGGTWQGLLWYIRRGDEYWWWVLGCYFWLFCCAGGVSGTKSGGASGGLGS
uniref:NADH-ubiquinone oxidoreductase chain 6 n=1 Tax=Oxyeleotris marmorata TaxID=86250 RepID=A0A068AAQ3_9TELE|nr:NADH dehydrogenase subunit 6 [Oxyeleotris marmorata]